MSVFSGTGAGDFTRGTADADTINGFGGDDELHGGDGNDSILGGDGGDQLVGDEGNDVLIGGEGFDSFGADAGNDTLDGGEGDNSLGFFNGKGVVVNLATGVVIKDGLGGHDQIKHITEIYGSDYADRIISDSKPGEYRYFETYGGNDTVMGGTGTDAIDYFFDYGSFGSALRQGIVADLVAGSVRGSYGDTDKISKIDDIGGSRFSDDFIGDSHATLYRPSFGADAVDGGAGIDQVSYETDFEYGTVLSLRIRFAGIDADLQTGNIRDLGGSVDTVVHVENVTGSTLDDTVRGDSRGNALAGIDGNDFLAGRGGNDKLLGGKGNDDLFGGAGADTLQGDAGDNSLAGGMGADRFVIGSADDYDTIRDFGGADKIDVTAFNFASRADVLALAIQDGSSVVLLLADDTTLELANTQLSDLAGTDFLV